MEIICHRINTIEQLQEISSLSVNYGAEIDVRYHQNDLVLHHDPFAHHEKNPTLLRDFLASYKQQGTLILNVKTEGVESECIELMKEYEIAKWFFLDLSMPYFVKYGRMIEKKENKDFSGSNLCVRYSEYEPLEYALRFQDLSRYVWVDCFEKLPPINELKTLANRGFKICLVSPELQGHPKEFIDDFAQAFQNNGLVPWGACTKFPEMWTKYFAPR